MNTTPAPPRLCVADEATFWPWFSWPDFAAWSDRERTLVVVPVAGMADWGLGQPLDAEENLLMSVLAEASLQRPPGLRILVIPPIRFALGPEPGCAFAVGPNTACNLLEEVVSSIGASGFSRVVFFNASPWMEELCKTVGRDLRISHRLQMFCVQLSALGLDFRPAQGKDRAELKALLAALTADRARGLPSPGREVLEKTAGRLALLFAEMCDRPALANGGALLPVPKP